MQCLADFSCGDSCILLVAVLEAVKDQLLLINQELGMQLPVACSCSRCTPGPPVADKWLGCYCASVLTTAAMKASIDSMESKMASMESKMESKLDSILELVAKRTPAGNADGETFGFAAE